jgi:hypothetical protein
MWGLLRKRVRSESVCQQVIPAFNRVSGLVDWDLAVRINQAIVRAKKSDRAVEALMLILCQQSEKIFHGNSKRLGAAFTIRRAVKKPGGA